MSSNSFRWFCTSSMRKNYNSVFWKQIVRRLYLNTIMANSKWEYVRDFESEQKLLQNCWAIARIDGRGFHKLAKLHNWKRPNDERGLKLMTRAARSVMADFNDVILAYGQSDEYSFVFRRETEVFERRLDKILTTLVSKFSSSFVLHWTEYFPDTRLQYPPSFDGRVVLYPTDRNLRDYLCWRQADCHINNLYNTTFWALVQQGNMTNSDAQKELKGTLSGDKNEILFSRFNINYNNEPEMYRKGTTLVQPAKAWIKPRRKPTSKKEKKLAKREQALKNDVEAQQSESDTNDYREEECAIELYCDIIGDAFWNEYPYLLNPEIIVKQSEAVANS